VAKRYCGHCHECGFVLQLTLAREEWCPNCKTLRHYKSHEHNRDAACPERLVSPGQAVRFENNVYARQAKLLSGLDCLPGQQDLFNA